MVGPRRTSCKVAVAVTAASFVLAGPVAHAAELPPCPGPFLPVFASHAPPSAPPRETGSRPDPGLSIDFRALRSGAPDTDGDGVADVVADFAGDGSNRLEVTRGDGTVSLGVAGSFERREPQPMVYRVGPWFGDFDGDGRDDLIVVSYRSVGGNGVFGQHLIPGTVPAGSHDPATVGIAMSAAPVELAGDRDLDGADDLLVADNPFDSGLSPDIGNVVSGRAAMVPGPGGSLTTLPPRLDKVARRVLGMLLLDDGPPAFVLGGPITQTTTELTVVGAPSLQLRTAYVEGQGYGGGINVFGYRSNGHRIVTLAGGTRSGSFVWAWDLDDLSPESRTAETVVVRPGDSLWRIAQRTFAARGLSHQASPDALWRYVAQLHEANRAVIGPDPGRLRIGVQLRLPPV